VFIACARLPRKLYAVDLSKASLAFARSVGVDLNLNNINFFHGSLLKELPSEIANKRYDFIVSKGVLHHMENPYLGFYNVQRLLAQDGVIMLSLYHPGQWKVKVMKAIISLFAGNDIKKRNTIALKLFRKYVERRHTSSEVPLEVTVRDRFSNPCERYVFLFTQLKWFHKNGIEFANCIPDCIARSKISRIPLTLVRVIVTDLLCLLLSVEQTMIFGQKRIS